MGDLTTEDFLKKMIKNSEERFMSYKKLLEDIFKDKAAFPVDDPFTIWYKDSLRESKNNEDIYLARLRDEQSYLRQGMNPPGFYPHKKK